MSSGNRVLASSADVAQALAGRLSPHPRIIVSDQDLAALQSAAASSSLAARAVADIRSAADALLQQPPVVRLMEGRRLLKVSREAMARMALLGLSYRLSREAHYLRRAREELLAIAAFEDFNPAEFLDTAEMAVALAMGLDWFHAELTADDRARLTQVIRDKAIAPSFDDRYNRWVNAKHNWNAVCHGGMVIAALAIAEHEPALAQRVIERALACAPNGMGVYAPDGAYPEGPSYWSYGTSFALLTVAALESAIGGDFGLSAAPGFMRSADYFLHVAGPSGAVFCYADARPERLVSLNSAQWYLAARLQSPSLLFSERAKAMRIIDAQQPLFSGPLTRFVPLAVKGWALAESITTPASTFYAGAGETPVALMRSGWDNDATFVGIKGGSARTNHAHLDAGTFVIDALGVRWATDLGMQDYNSLEQLKIDIWDMGQNSPRWDVYRMGAMSHNIVTIDGRRPNVAGRGELTAVSSRRADMNLTDVYAGQLTSAKRAVELTADDGVTVEDVLVAAADQTVQIRWAFLTEAQAHELADGSIELRREGRTMHVSLKSPAGLRLQIVERDPKPAAYDEANPGITVIGAHLPLAAGQIVTIRAVFQPQGVALATTPG